MLPGFYWTKPKRGFHRQVKGWTMCEIDEDGRQWYVGLDYGCDPDEKDEFIGPMEPPDSVDFSLDDILLEPRAAAQMLHVSLKRVYKWAYAGKIPWIKFERKVRFRRVELRRWLKTKERGKKK